MFEEQPFIGESDDLTIEHLVPQAKIGEGFEDTTVGQIGNLILVDEETNGLLAHNDFAAKKVILTQRGYKLPANFLEADGLTPELIRANTLRVAEIARERVWKV